MTKYISKEARDRRRRIVEKLEREGAQGEAARLIARADRHLHLAKSIRAQGMKVPAEMQQSIKRDLDRSGDLLDAKPATHRRVLERAAIIKR